jgi:putative DNA primase/helicase
VSLVHHTGVSTENQERARGSSAWRGALDIEISVIPSKGDSPLQIVQRKSKDAELSTPIFADLKKVIIPGWIDEDGEPVSSAVVEIVDAPAHATAKTESKIESYIKTFKNAWGKTGQELRLDAPYISRSGLLDYLVEEMGIKEPTARVYLTPGSTGKLIHDLLNAQIIKPHENGWIVIANDLVSVMMIGMKNGRQ